MSVGVVVDTNVLVYALDARDPVKRSAARALLAKLAEAGRGVLTAQVLAEYFSVATSKLAPPLDPVTAALQVAEFRRAFSVLDVTADVVEDAARGVVQHQLSFWDAQLWATARLAGFDVILSEDFQDGREIEGVRFVDPFGRGFRLEGWLGS
ncbi:MAG: PIN domain-containing protein [Anaerosomatales bacterium]|nr:PIN domain-containing protein [Anaerosomatales bacterium]